MEESNKTNAGVKYWLRWVGVLPGGLVAGILASFPLHWILYFSLRNETIFIDPYPESLERALFPFVMAVVFVWAGFRIAPEHKIKTALVLSAGWACLSIVVIVLTLSGASFMGRKLFLYGGGIGSILSIAGAAVGYQTVKRKSFEEGGQDKSSTGF